MNNGEAKPKDDHFKQLLCETNIEQIRELFRDFENFEFDEYNKSTKKPTKKPVLKSRSSVEFFGFLNNMRSVLGINSYYAEGGLLDVFYIFQFSQDHLETFFSLIRSSLRCNNNPNVSQFRCAYRKLLVCMPHLSVKFTNCIPDNTKVLTKSTSWQSTQPIEPSLDQVHVIEINTEEFYDTINAEIEPYERHMQAFIYKNL